MASSVDPVEAQALLQKHLLIVQEDPSTLLDSRLFDSVGPLLSRRSRAENAALVQKTLRTLPDLQQDPAPLIRLLLQLIASWSFSDIITLEPSPNLEQGLGLDAIPYNGLALWIIHRAAETSVDAAHIAGSSVITYQLVRLWLFTTDMGVAEQAGTVIMDLLRIDKEPSDVVVHGVGDDLTTVGGRGQGLVWRRIFGDKDVYGLLYEACDLGNDQGYPSLGRKQKTIAQARLMDFAIKLGALDWGYLIRSHISEVESSHGLESGEGLLDFVACRMCASDDILIQVNLIDFFADLINKVPPSSKQEDHSVALEYMKEKNLHDSTVKAWMSPDDSKHDPVSITFIYGPSAHYISTFVSKYPQAFLSNPQNVLDTLRRLCATLDSVSSSEWSLGQFSRHDLNVLMALPRIALLPQSSLGIGIRSSPLMRIPCRATSSEGLKCLAQIFRGPKHELGNEKRSELDGQDVLAEAAAARAAFIVYLRYNKDLFKHLIGHAETVALPEKALAALNLIACIADAEWATLPSTEGGHDPGRTPKTLSALPTEDSLRSILPASPEVPERLGDQGIHALVQSPARETLFPYLVRPPQRFNNLMGGRGDPENAAY
ncbi:MAG: hypothetical protein M1828_004353 [Chrysothrix sp. TS-e1954]|nr:MAG: hypothetical protein M1828_004353 [Chrysothrix sp. TS-e1954]